MVKAKGRAKEDSEPNSASFLPEGSGHTVAACLILVLAFSLFLRSSAPTVTAGDSGELLCAAATAGVPHPPGYPLWMLVNKCLMTAIPLGSMGFRGALSSALAGAIACSLLTSFVTRSLASVSFGILAGLTLMVSKTMWDQSAVAEVYPINVAVSACLAAVALQSSTRRTLAAFSILLGLGLANHHTVVLAAVPLGLLGLSTLADKRKLPRFILYWASFGLIGLAAYVAMVIRSNGHPPMNWGVPNDLEGAMLHVLRKQYGTPWAGERTLSLSLLQLRSFVDSVANQWTVYLLWLIPVGWIEIWRRSKAHASAFLGVVLLSGPGLVLLLNPELEREALEAVSVFYIPSQLMLAAFIAVGLGVCIQRGVVPTILGLKEVAGSKKTLHWIPALLLLLPFSRNSELLKRRNDWTAHNYAQDLLLTVGREAIMFTSSDHEGFPAAYLQIVEGKSPNVLALDAYGDPYLPTWSQRPLLKSELEKARLRERFVMEWLNAKGNDIFFLTKASPIAIPGARLAPYGISYRLQHAQMPTVEPGHLWDRYLSTPQDAPRDYGNDMIASDYVIFRGAAWLEQGKTIEALSAFQDAQRMSFGVKETYNNIGSMLAERGLFGPAAQQFEKALDINPDYAMARANLGRVKLEMGDVAEAINQFDAALRLDPGNYTVYNDLGRALLRLGHKEDAVQMWERSLEINEDQEVVKAWVSQYAKEGR